MDEAHQFLIREEFLLNGALDQIKDIITAVDQQNKIVYLNRAAAKQYNTDKNKAIGMKLTQLYRQLWVNPDDEHQAYLSLKEKGF